MSSCEENGPGPAAPTNQLLETFTLREPADFGQHPPPNASVFRRQRDACLRRINEGRHDFSVDELNAVAVAQAHLSHPRRNSRALAVLVSGPEQEDATMALACYVLGARKVLVIDTDTLVNRVAFYGGHIGSAGYGYPVLVRRGLVPDVEYSRLWKPSIGRHKRLRKTVSRASAVLMPDVVCVSRPSHKRLPDGFDLVVFRTESHLRAPALAQVIAKFPSARVLLITSAPARQVSRFAPHTPILACRGGSVRVVADTSGDLGRTLSECRGP